MMMHCSFCTADRSYDEPIYELTIATKYEHITVGACKRCATSIKKNRKRQKSIIQYFEKMYERKHNISIGG